MLPLSTGCKADPGGGFTSAGGWLAALEKRGRYGIAVRRHGAGPHGASGTGAAYRDALLLELAGTVSTTIVFDDFEVVTNPGLLDLLATIIEQAPSTHHFFLATRVDPPLHYFRLRLVDSLGEVRKEDLAFRPEEAVELLGHPGNGAGRPPQVDAVLAHTDGWPAGLELAADVLREGVDDEAFALLDSCLAEYLNAQLLAPQSERTRRFLLSTSVLDRMSGPLCDAV